ncbi:right-handed parallel beta-helix repeat-containing protein [Massilia sp. R798]|uniref:Right-handed parallel beta-helix repeat-containing protein n=2 Tax=Massilia soli TaxID=2792854 RepID=A0ABS7SUQ7_9BURK|nr:right-handed parallel beta-helix repeat-containing protein [Massilia soli]
MGGGTAADPLGEIHEAVHLAHANRDALYVSPSGSDGNPGTSTRPFRSLARAARAVRAGTTVYVAPGIYNGGFRTTASGRQDARISWISTRKWGAKLVPPPGSRTKVAWDNRGDYVDVIGFEIDGRQHRDGLRWTHGIYNGGSYDSIRNNYVHHIAQKIQCTSGGGAAIGIDSYYRGVKSDVIANLIHDIGPAGCHFVQGIYVSTSGTVKNNVVYRVAEAGIHLWHDANRVIITNNTVTESNTGIIVGGGNFYHTKGPNDYTLVYSNIVYDNKMGISEQGRTGKNNSYRNNLVYRNARFNWSLKNGLTHSGTVSSAPLFVGENASVPNLKPSRSSPAVGQASPAHAASTDFDGRARNASTGYDIGAYQH